ncbi:hypothetical protein [Aureliella helgolandensis]|uniref:Uncharacterized protein n=1 Tax=Aureliella helgolandensis TaxID=2527968 RepID=A0A518G4F8_9BACT|nr:hypothetical protein [Aureliella helgolandensis]QDV23429.1 hypothetical protein Q31a_17270 [Aureliella helgolandensis]
MARSFRDSKDTLWHVMVNVSVARSLLRGEEPIDILNAKSLAGVMDDPYQRFAVLWAACHSQALAVGLATPEEFDRYLLPGELSPEEAERIWAEAEVALREALIDFFHRIGQKALAGVIAQTIAARTRLDNLSVTKLQGTKVQRLIDHAAEKADQQMDAELDHATAEIDRLILGRTSGN